MSLKIKCALFATALALLSTDAHAQMEKLSKATLESNAGEISNLASRSKSDKMKKHLKGISSRDLVKASNAARVAKDVENASFKDFVYYAVEPMSELQRLPDTYPVDGKALDTVRIVAAQDEYEPGSFVVYPLANLGKVKLVPGEFKNAEGKVFPKDNIDIKVIKVWYQNGNGWYSYFGDTGLKLTPELLLNDEDLIKVDTDKTANYARLTAPDGKVKYHWLTPAREFDSRYDEHYIRYQTFSPMKADFDDAKTLQSVTFDEGAFKQFFITVHVTDSIAPGLYKGAIDFVKESDNSNVGTVPVAIRVLPFKLPMPKSYDMKKDYLTSSYSYISFDLIAKENGGDYDLAQKQMLATFKNQVSHNQMMHWVRGKPYDYEYKRTLELMKEAGMRTDYITGGGVVDTNPYATANDAKFNKKWYADNGYGDSTIFLGYGDEPGAGWLMKSRPVFEAYQKEGFKFIIAGGAQVYYKTGYIYDFHNASKNPEDREATRKWNELGTTHVAWYATHHIGPENPAYNRRQYGIAPYLAGYSATCNYAHHYGPYNDHSNTYRPMVFAYGSHSGVIDTIQWEGYREGVDDIRYATLLKELALEAQKSDDIKVRYAGNKALQLFASADPATCDPAMMRSEMINHILKLKTLLGK